MSLRNKLAAAAAHAATEAVGNERGRILAALERMETELIVDFNKKVLIESERHAAQTKLAIFRKLAAQVRVIIASGVSLEDDDEEEEGDDRLAIPG